ncbi:MAG: hypothetical protein QOD29_6020, partial [Alphaproteobacteria bacterium]|nr:hypothetical protein [Alphaproteobacteria bacterium]
PPARVKCVSVPPPAASATGSKFPLPAGLIGAANNG